MWYIYVKTDRSDSVTSAFRDALFLRSSKNREYYKIEIEDHELDRYKDMLQYDGCVIEFTVLNKPRRKRK